MKRIFALILAAVMILAAVPAMAADPDPIVGVWYASSEASGTQIVSVFIFDSYSKVYQMALDLEPTGYSASASVDPTYIGNWVKVRTGVYTIVTLSKVTASRDSIYLDGDKLYIPATASSYWIHNRMLNGIYDFIPNADMETIKNKY